MLVTGLAAAGLYAASLGPTGALAQDPTPTGTAEPTPTHTAEPTQTPTQTPESSPESTATASPEASSSPSGTPESTATAAPTATAISEPTAGADPTAAATPEEPLGGGDIDFSESIDIGEFVIDLDDPALDTSPGSRTLPICPPSARKRTGARAKASKASKVTATIRKGSAGLGSTDSKKVKRASTSDRGLDCKPNTKTKLKTPLRNSDGTPTLDNPTFSDAVPGAAPIGVPNFMIEKFRIPPFLLPIYQAAGIQYGVRWEVLAAINEIETDYGRNLNISSAGALGWMQFMPATWKAYGVDANKDGLRDPFNPVDAIFAAARYLRAAGAETDLRKAIFAYNHADWYVDSVLLRARMIGGLPSNFVGSLTGLTQARFPVHARARYAGDISEREATKKVKVGQNAAMPVESQSGRRGIKIFSKRGAPVIAVNDGRIVRVGKTRRLGRYVQLQDVYGNVFTYAHLAKVSQTYPAPRLKKVSKEQIRREMKLPARDKAPKAAASSTVKKGAAQRTRRETAAPRKERVSANRTAPKKADPLATTADKERLYAHPARPDARAAGGELQLAEASYKPVAGAPLSLNRRDWEAKPLKKGARVLAGTILGRIGKIDSKIAPHLLFEIRPAGRGAPRIDPKPILDGWKLLENTEIYRAAGKNPFFGRDARTPSIGQILLMGKEALVQRVLANPRIQIYGCGRRDVRLGAIDRRVLATLEFLAASGLKPTVTSLKCGHGYYTAGGSVSHHSSGNAVDIAAINGIPMLGNQGKGSITEMAVQRLLTLQGTLKPDQIITLMTFEGADNTYAMGDHHDHIHVGWRPLYGTNSRAAKEVNAVLKPRQWIKLIDRLKEIDNPTVRTTPSKYATKVKGHKKGHGHGRASQAHVGE